MHVKRNSQALHSLDMFAINESVRFKKNRALVLLSFGSHPEKKKSLIFLPFKPSEDVERAGNLPMHWSTCRLSDKTANRRSDTLEDTGKTNT